MNAETLKLGAGIFTATDAARILGLPKSRVAYWFRSYIKNKLEVDSDFRYYRDLGNNQIAVNFNSLIEFYVFQEFKKRGVKTKVILEAHKEVGRALNTPYPFASARFLVYNGTILLNLDDASFVEANRALQFIINEFVIDFCSKIEFGEDNLPTRFYPIGKEKSVVVDPHHQFGSPTIKGTNILTSTIVQLHKAGDPVKLIAKLYDISEAQVSDSIAFANVA